jgi:ABC-2 type transport system ATP-binding protein
VLTTHYLEEAEALCNRVAMLKNGSIVVLDSVKNLISNISGHRIRLRLSPDTLPAALQLLTIGHDQGYYVLAIEEYSQLENVMTALRATQTQVLELQILQPDLEEVFVKIMHDAESLEPQSV